MKALIRNSVRPSRNTEVSVTGAGRRVTLHPGDEIITFISRDLEPMRGYHTFLRILPAILHRRPNARAVIVGGDGVSYGAAPPAGTSWKELFFGKCKIVLMPGACILSDACRTKHWWSYCRCSAAHLYLSYPFVLSWSMLEAMSAEPW